MVLGTLESGLEGREGIYEKETWGRRILIGRGPPPAKKERERQREKFLTEGGK